MNASQELSSITVMSDWFHNMFVPEVCLFLNSKRLQTKAILLLDNTPGHPNKKDGEPSNLISCGNIKTKFLPPTTTLLIQPMDQGVLESLTTESNVASPE